MSTPVVIAESPKSTLKSAISHHPLMAFFVLAFGLTWPFMIADAIGSWGLLPFRLTLAGMDVAV